MIHNTSIHTFLGTERNTVTSEPRHTPTHPRALQQNVQGPSRALFPSQTHAEGGGTKLPWAFGACPSRSGQFKSSQVSSCQNSVRGWVGPRGGELGGEPVGEETGPAEPGAGQCCSLLFSRLLTFCLVFGIMALFVSCSS